MAGGSGPYHVGQSMDGLSVLTILQVASPRVNDEREKDRETEREGEREREEGESFDALYDLLTHCEFCHPVFVRS